MRRWWSGLSQQTVNLSASAFVGSNPTRRTNKKNGFIAVFLVASGWIRKTEHDGASRGREIFQKKNTCDRNMYS